MEYREKERLFASALTAEGEPASANEYHLYKAMEAQGFEWQTNIPRIDSTCHYPQRIEDGKQWVEYFKIKYGDGNVWVGMPFNGRDAAEIPGMAGVYIRHNQN